jgi:hypothetical protein
MNENEQIELEHILKVHYGAKKVLFDENYVHVDGVDIEFVKLAMETELSEKYNIYIKKVDEVIKKCILYVTQKNI